MLEPKRLSAADRSPTARWRMGRSFARPCSKSRTPASPIVQQETFGPVLTIQRFCEETDAIALANDSEYGLSASVWTRDLDRALRVAQALEVGSVFVNDWAKVYDSTEEGGFKLSGLGSLNGAAALDDFIEYKHVALKPGRSGNPHQVSGK
ncbi:aldehyde dehydrogenase family protein [Sinorhizobium meliloti]|uniref:aldehyde dehydrogenase family protein n=1 Tax=Rhizobium meliloti TaxID=382 RepID=UPI00307DA529